MDDDLIGAFEELPCPAWRTLGEDTMRLGRARNHVPVLLEVDVTEARAALGRRKQQGGPDVSFTAWVVKCIAQAASEHRRVHAVRGRRWGGAWAGGGSPHPGDGSCRAASAGGRSSRSPTST